MCPSQYCNKSMAVQNYILGILELTHERRVFFVRHFHNRVVTVAPRTEALQYCHKHHTSISKAWSHKGQCRRASCCGSYLSGLLARLVSDVSDDGPLAARLSRSVSSSAWLLRSSCRVYTNLLHSSWRGWDTCYGMTTCYLFWKPTKFILFT